MDIYTFLVIVHLIGTVLGVGGFVFRQTLCQIAETAGVVAEETASTAEG